MGSWEFLPLTHPGRSMQQAPVDLAARTTVLFISSRYNILRDLRNVHGVSRYAVFLRALQI